MILPEQQTLQTIVLTDVAGYTEKMRLDEPGTLRQLRSDLDIIREEFEKEGGNIVKVVGDGVYALFASSPAALRAALRCQKRLRASGLDHRTAIHVGEVTQTDGDLHGDAVNICSRIEALCLPGAVFASKVVLDMVGSQGIEPPNQIRKVTLKGVPGTMELAIWGDVKQQHRRWMVPATLVAVVIAVAALATQQMRPSEPATNGLKSFPSSVGANTTQEEAAIVESWMDQAFDELWQEIEEYDSIKAEAMKSLDADQVIKWLQGNPLGSRERGKREVEHWKLVKVAIDFGKQTAGAKATREQTLKVINQRKDPSFEIAKQALLEEVEKYP